MPFAFNKCKTSDGVEFEGLYEIQPKVFGEIEYIPFTHVLFFHGYSKNRKSIEKEIDSITIGKPQKGMCPDEWLDTDVFIIRFK